MDEMRILLERFWITREFDKDLYFKVKRALPQLERFIMNQLGWKLFVNERFIRLEKIPAYGETFMGIQEFKEIKDYSFLCGLLIFLEDKDDREQFLLSELLDGLETYLAEYMEVDWTKFTERKSLVRALKFAESVHMLTAHEGDSDALAGNLGHEILYENTGLSRFFSVHFSRSIEEIKSVEDFEQYQGYQLDETRGYTRINRVYRQLVLSPAMYWESIEDADSLYLRNQRQWVAKYLEENLGGRLHIHKNAAFFMLEEDNCFGSRHPRDAMLPEVVLLFCASLRREVAEGRLEKDIRDFINIDEERLMALLAECRRESFLGWGKEYREMSNDKLFSQVTAYMMEWKMIGRENSGWVIYPGMGKSVGAYPQEFIEKHGGQ